MRLSDSLKQLGRAIVFYPRLAEVFGIPESIFISHFVYWSDKGDDPDGWIYKSVEEIEAETGLTYEQQKRIGRVLTGTSHDLVGHHRTKRALAEAILLKKYDRTNHRMFFRIDFESLDRAFSQGQLFPIVGGHRGIPPVPPRDSHSATGGFPRSSISESTTETTTNKNTVVRKAAHKTFVKFFDEMAVKVRGKKPTYDAAGFRNLKIALETIDESLLERLCLYYLADSKFQGYALELKTFLSGGVMKALADQQSKYGFVKRLDSYVSLYFKRFIPTIYSEAIVQSAMKVLVSKFSLPVSE